jgi:DNA-binding NarL/FixJ family response regulator
MQSSRRDLDQAMKMRTYVVEDNATIRENLISTLEELAPVQTVGSADSEEEGAAWLSGHDGQWDLAIVDLFLKNGSGLRVLEACRKRGALQRMVVFTNYATREMRMRCAQLGVDAVFDKSTEIDNLLAYCVAQSQIMDSAASQDSGRQHA